MAYVPNTTEAEEDDKKRTNISGSSASSSAGSALGAGPGVGTSAAAPSTSSGSFTNLNDYLKANAPGATKLGENVAGVIGSGVSNAKNTINQSAQNFQNQVQANTVNYDKNSIQNAINTGNITDVVKNQLSAQYKGPTNLTEAGFRQNIENTIKQAQEKANLSSTAGGRVEILRSLAGTPQTPGNTRLNSALLQGNEVARNKIADVARQASGLNTEFTNAEALAAQRAAEARAISQRTKDTAFGDINSALDTANADYQTRLANLTAERAREAGLANNYLKTVTNVADYKNKVPGFENLGINQTDAERLQYNISENARHGARPSDLSAFYTPANTSALTQANVISPADAARLTALAQLAGREGYTSAAAPIGRFDLDAAYNKLVNDRLTAINDNYSAALKARNQAAYVVPVPEAPVVAPPRSTSTAAVNYLNTIANTSDYKNKIGGYESLGLSGPEADRLQYNISENARHGAAPTSLTSFYDPTSGRFNLNAALDRLVADRTVAINNNLTAAEKAQAKAAYVVPPPIPSQGPNIPVTPEAPYVIPGVTFAPPVAAPVVPTLVTPPQGPNGLPVLRTIPRNATPGR